jgi:hypothetical protein
MGHKEALAQQAVLRLQQVWVALGLTVLAEGAAAAEAVRLVLVHLAEETVETILAVAVALAQQE